MMGKGADEGCGLGSARLRRREEEEEEAETEEEDMVFFFFGGRLEQLISDRHAA